MVLRSDQRRFGRVNSAPDRGLAVGRWEERRPVKAFCAQARGLGGKVKRLKREEIGFPKNISVRSGSEDT